MSVIVVDRKEREILGRRASKQVLIGVAACESSGVVVVSESSAGSQAVEAMGVCVWCWRRRVIGRWGRPIQTERAGAIVSRTSSRRGSSRKARATRKGRLASDKDDASRHTAEPRFTASSASSLRLRCYRTRDSSVTVESCLRHAPTNFRYRHHRQHHRIHSQHHHHHRRVYRAASVIAHPLSSICARTRYTRRARPHVRCIRIRHHAPGSRRSSFPSLFNQYYSSAVAANLALRNPPKLEASLQIPTRAPYHPSRAGVAEMDSSVPFQSVRPLSSPLPQSNNNPTSSRLLQ